VAGDVKLDVVQQLEDLLSIARAEKARGELKDPSLGAWLIKQLPSMRRYLPRTAPGASGTGASRELPPREPGKYDAKIITFISKPNLVTPSSLSFRRARATNPGSTKAAHGLDQQDHEGQDLQGMAMLRDGWPAEPPRGGTGRRHETESWQGENAIRARMSTLSPLRRVFSVSPIRTYTGEGSMYRSQVDFDDVDYGLVGAAGGAGYASSSEKSSARADLEESGSELGSQDIYLSDETGMSLSESEVDRDTGEEDDLTGDEHDLDGDAQSASSRRSSAREKSLAHGEDETDLDAASGSRRSQSSGDEDESDSYTESISQESQDESPYTSEQDDEDGSDSEIRTEENQSAKGTDLNEDQQSAQSDDEYDEGASQTGSEGAAQSDGGYY
ncbi:unnamed protein product, partial [Peniophora sp. CBMAI 1063]